MVLCCVLDVSSVILSITDLASLCNNNNVQYPAVLMYLMQSCILYISSINPINSLVIFYFHPHFILRESEAWRGEGKCLKQRVPQFFCYQDLNISVICYSARRPKETPNSFIY